MTIRRKYPLDSMQAGRFLDTIQPSLDVIFDFCDDLETTIGDVRVIAQNNSLNANLDKQLSSLENQVNNLKTQVARVEQNQATPSDIQNEVDQLRNSLEDVKRDISDANNNASGATSDVGSLKSRLSKIEQQLKPPYWRTFSVSGARQLTHIGDNSLQYRKWGNGLVEWQGGVQCDYANMSRRSWYTVGRLSSGIYDRNRAHIFPIHGSDGPDSAVGKVLTSGILQLGTGDYVSRYYIFDSLKYWV